MKEQFEGSIVFVIRHYFRIKFTNNICFQNRCRSSRSSKRRFSGGVYIKKFLQEMFYGSPIADIGFANQQKSRLARKIPTYNFYNYQIMIGLRSSNSHISAVQNSRKIYMDYIIFLRLRHRIQIYIKCWNLSIRWLGNSYTHTIVAYNYFDGRIIKHFL